MCLESLKDGVSILAGTNTKRVPSFVASTGTPDNALDCEELACEPTDEEVRAALIQLKNGKCPREDFITTELLKLGGETTVRWLVALSQSIWRAEEMPEDWRCQIIIPLHKKGATDVCNNYRGIALLSVPSKVIYKII